MANRIVRETLGDRIFTFFTYFILSCAMIIVLYPLIYVVSASFSSANAVLSGKVWLWPVDFTLDGYAAVFRHEGVVTGYINTIFYTVVGTAINIAMTIMAAYPLARKDFCGRNIIMFIFAFTMFFNGGLIPTYLLVKDLGMINTRWAMIIPGALSVWNVIITRTYFQANIPDELLEAAKLDGCSDLTFIKSIVIPLSTPIIAVMTLFYAVGHWNEFFNALIYLNDPELYPLQLVLREILVQNEVKPNMILDPELRQRMDNLRELLKYSLIVVASVPVLIMYPFIQKYFVKGIMIGAIKG
jgi:multiple sugar transport system permease protein/putative aldouronate transport system permease protein